MSAPKEKLAALLQDWRAWEGRPVDDYEMEDFLSWCASVVTVDIDGKREVACKIMACVGLGEEFQASAVTNFIAENLPRKG